MLPILSIIDLNVEEKKVSLDDLKKFEHENVSIPEALREAVEKGEVSNFNVSLTHLENQRVPLNLNEESDGYPKTVCFSHATD